MGPSFLAWDRGQSFLLPPDVREWLPEGHFAWFVIDAVEAIDLDAFCGAYRGDGRCRPAYDPAVMVALVLYAYARGTRSSRAIERACGEDVAYRVIAANQQPDHATLARFIVRHQQALADVFGSVLELCAKAGLAGVNVVAVDGSKLAANASREATRDYAGIAREIVEQGIAVDAEEDERFGDRRGDELPSELSTGDGRKKWLARAKRELDERRAQEARPIPRSRPARVKEAKRRLDEELWTEIQANRDYEALRARGLDRRGRPLPTNVGSVPKPYSPPASPQGEINTTDLDSRMVKGRRGWVQGYNAQAAANEHQIILAAEVTVSSPDFGNLEPVVSAARRELAAIGITETPGVVVADSGYWHTEQMQRLAGDGIAVLIPPQSGLRTTERPGWTGGLYSFMRRVLATEHGAALYQQRQYVIESVFGHTKHNRQIRSFHRRGRAAVRTEWRLITATHNLLKLHTHQLTATAA